MITGIGMPFSIFCVCALNALQNSMMLRPRWPSAGPIGGDGLAAHAGTCNLRNPVTFFAISHSVSGADLAVGSRLTSHVISPSCHALVRASRLGGHDCANLSGSPDKAGDDSSLKLLHLSEFQFDRSSAAEDR